MDLTPDQQCIVQATYDVFRESGRWPIVDAIDRMVDERWDFDAYTVLQSLPTQIALMDRIHLREDQTVQLRLRAIAGCEGSQEDLDLFVRAARWLAEKERSFRPASPHAVEQLRVTSEQFVADLAGEGVKVDSVALAKVYSLADIERLSWGGSHNLEGDPVKWEINLTRNIRPFRRVETLADYMEIRDRLDAGEDAARQASGLAPILMVDAPDELARPVDDRPYIFIAMPFGAAWSTAVHERIERSCGRVDASGLALRWERADQIERPGRITEQIRDALTAADVVIADISDLNANVIYELGYADASQTPLILLSQNPSGSPFDIKDIRQIKDSLTELDLVEERLVSHLRAALGGDGALS
jgi:hypothetical protein